MSLIPQLQFFNLPMGRGSFQLALLGPLSSVVFLSAGRERELGERVSNSLKLNSLARFQISGIKAI
jgi:hypothetical protein